MSLQTCTSHDDDDYDHDGDDDDDADDVITRVAGADLSHASPRRLHSIWGNPVGSAWESSGTFDIVIDHPRRHICCVRCTACMIF